MDMSFGCEKASPSQVRVTHADEFPSPGTEKQSEIS